MTDLTFVWNVELQKWVAVGPTLARFAKDNTLPPEAQLSGNKIEKNGKLYLFVPRSKEADLVKLNPDFAQGQNPIEEQLTIVRDVIAKPIKAYDKWYEENKNKPLAEALGIPKEGIADAVTTNIKSFFAGKRGTPVDVNEPLPKTIIAQETGTIPGVAATPTGKGVLGSDYIPSSFTAEPAIAGVNYSAITIDDEENLGLFTVNKKSNQLLLPQQTGSKSELVDANKFVNVTLYNLPPEKVKQYQAKYGVNQTGKMNAALAGKIFSDARKASYENYVRSNPEVITDKTQVSWEDAVINPASIGGAGDGSGISAKQIRSSKEAIRISANQLGVTLDDAKLNSLANAYARGDISASVLPYEIARQGEIDYTKGAAGNTYNKLRELASAYGIQYSEDWYKNSVAGILSGKESEDTYDINIKELAKSKYPTLAKQIDAGRNVRDLASPYIQTMSQILELSPDAINVDDFYINQALTGLDAEGNPKQKPLWEFQQQLRQDPRWNYTRNAQDSLMGTARKVLQDFGLVS